MLLIDYSQVSIASVMVFQKDLEKGSADDVNHLIRHVTLNSIRSYKKQYGKVYGNPVICCDGWNYWRRQFFPLYKGHRKKAREESKIDWNLVFDCLNGLQEDLREHFPYKVIHLEGAEADDVIAVLAQSTQEFGRYEDVMIISSDKDFKQLLLNDNVKQYHPIKKKLISASKSEIFQFMVEHIVKGDSGDGIPNILSADDAIMTGTRQSPVSSKRLEEFYKYGKEACRDTMELTRWDRNKTLVAFDHIPEDVAERINQAYEVKPKGNKNTVMQYLIKNRCRNLMDNLEDF